MASSCNLELVRFSALLIESKTEPSVAKGGDTAQKKYILEGGEAAPTLLRWGHRTYLIGVGTPHNIETKSLAVGGLGGARPEYNTTLWLHLAS